jgi:peptide/nickel transport system ATP-binding protein/oligopeptide transport system ATP-binding protein
MSVAAPLLAVRGLRVGFPSVDGQVIEAVRGVDFAVADGVAVGVVGESGSGKSLSMLALIRLIAPPGRITGGDAAFGGEDLIALDEKRLRRIRGRDIAMVFQDPQSSLNPSLSIGRQIADVLRAHTAISAGQSRQAAAAALERVGISADKWRAYPHELSGGMRQRVMIAMAIACRPRLLIADEPTTALDVTVQAQIVTLLAELRRELGLSIIFISHNLQLVSEIVDRVIVMYGGKIVEDGPVETLFRSPRHPYTVLLKACVPNLDDPPGPLTAIEGSPPHLGQMPVGCPFTPRCPRAIARCAVEMPALVTEGATGDHRLACWNPA